jgi:hypothetical protein
MARLRAAARSARGPTSPGGVQALELLRLDGADERFADLGKHHTVKGSALDRLAAHQPVEEGARRTRVSLSSTLYNF